MAGFLLWVMGLWMLIVKSLYFFLPAYFANMAPVLLKWVPVLGKPVWGKQFGKNKTWRGLIAASLTGVLVFWLQKCLFGFSFFYKISLIDYGDFSLWLGFLLGGGAILGDLAGSYFKRRRKVKEGDSWMPWDQLDFVIGGLLLGWLVYVPSVGVVVVLLVLSPFLHASFSWLGYRLRLKKNKF